MQCSHVTRSNVTQSNITKQFNTKQCNLKQITWHIQTIISEFGLYMIYIKRYRMSYDFQRLCYAMALHCSRYFISCYHISQTEFMFINSSLFYCTCENVFFKISLCLLICEQVNSFIYLFDYHYCYYYYCDYCVCLFSLLEMLIILFFKQTFLCCQIMSFLNKLYSQVIIGYENVKE